MVRSCLPTTWLSSMRWRASGISWTCPTSSPRPASPSTHGYSPGGLLVDVRVTWEVYATISREPGNLSHHSNVIICTMASQITSLTIVYSTVYSGADQRKHQSSASLAFVRGIHRWPVNSPHKGPVTRKIFPFDNVIMSSTHRSRVIQTKFVCIRKYIRTL